MKKTILIAASSVLLLTLSCTKNTEGNKSVIKQEGVYSEDLPKDTVDVTYQITAGDESAKEYTDRYVGADGTSALVTFNNEEKTISIRSNNKTIAAPQKEVSAAGTIYGNYDFTILFKNDSIKITQEDNVILLKKARGQ